MLTNLLVVAPMMVLLTSRIWFLHFDLRYNVSILNYNWWETITNETNWYIRNKKTYGSFKKYMWKYILLFIILWSIISIVCWFVNDMLLMVTFTLIANTFWGFMIWCLCKMPPQYDVLLIRFVFI